MRRLASVGRAEPVSHVPNCGHRIHALLTRSATLRAVLRSQAAPAKAVATVEANARRGTLSGVAVAAGDGPNPGSGRDALRRVVVRRDQALELAVHVRSTDRLRILRRTAISTTPRGTTIPCGISGATVPCGVPTPRIAGAPRRRASITAGVAGAPRSGAPVRRASVARASIAPIARASIAPIARAGTGVRRVLPVAVEVDEERLTGGEPSGRHGQQRKQVTIVQHRCPTRLERTSVPGGCKAGVARHG